MSNFSISKIVSALPSVLDPNTIYIVRVATGYDQYVTNSAGTIVPYKSNPSIDIAALTTTVNNLTTTVNGKEPTITTGTTSQYWRGDKTWTDFATTSRAIVLTGFVTSTNSAVVASDTLLVSLGKLQAQMNNRLLTTDTAAATTKLATARTINGVAFDGTANITIADATKEPAIAAGAVGQYWGGDKTWTNFATTTRSVTLTGLSLATSTAITETDTVLSAAGKLQAQVTALSNGKLDASANAASATKLATPRNINGVAFDGTADITIVDATKEAAIAAGTAAQYWSGTKVWTDFGTTTRSTVLTGFVTTNSAVVAATDSVLVGMGKLQAQVTARLLATGTAVAATKLATARNINGVAFDGTADITITDSTKEASIAAGTTAQFWRGDKTWQDTDTATRGAILTGATFATNSAVVATDTLLVGIGKLQTQINNRLLSTANAVSATKLVTARTINGVSFDGTANITVVDATKIATSLMGVANGVATLDANGLIPTAQLPASASNTDGITEGTTNLYFTNARVLATPLTGVVFTANSTIAAADSLLVGLGKLQTQINNRLLTTGTAATATKLLTARTINGVAFDGTANITIAAGEPTIAAGTTAQFWRGDKTWQDTDTATRGALLTGVVTTNNTPLTATDTLLVGVGKLQAQQNAATSSLGDFASQNMAYNPTFRADANTATTGMAEGWLADSSAITSPATGTWSVVPSFVSSAENAQRIDFTGVNTSSLYRSIRTSAQQRIPAAAGMNIVGSTYFRATVGVQCRMYIQALNSSGTAIGSPASNLITADGTVQRMFLAYPALPAGTVTTQLFYRVFAGASGTPTDGFVEFARPQFEIGTVPSGWKDSSGTLASDIATAKGLAGLDPAPGAVWNFENDIEGWLVSGATLTTTVQSNLRITASTADPYIVSPTISVDGSIYPIIRFKLTRIAGSGWDGRIFTRNSAHSWTNFFEQIPDPLLQVGSSTIIECDMSTLSTGGNDWITSIATGIRLDLGSTASDVFDIDWIAIGRIAPSASSADVKTLQSQMVGKLPLTGGLLTGELQTTSTNAIRIASTTYGSIFRQDSSYLYLLLTANGDQYGAWTTARPFTVNLATGIANISGNAATASVLGWTDSTETAMITGTTSYTNKPQGVIVEGIYSGVAKGYPINFGNRVLINSRDLSATEIYHEWTSGQTRMFVRSRGDVSTHTWTAAREVAFADGSIASAAKLATARTITLSGDATGSISFDGSANVTIPVIVVDDSHNHIIGNVDGLQAALDLKAPLASPVLTGTPTAPTAAVGTSSTQLATTAFVQSSANGLLTKSVAGGATVTLTAIEAGYSMLKFTGALTANIAVVVPAVAGSWRVINATTGAFTLTIKTPSGTGTPITQGLTWGVICDGVNVIDGLTDFYSTAFTGAPTAPTPVSTDNSTTLSTTAFVQTAVASKQANLGFTPVQQGGGTGQSTNKIYLGWSTGSTLNLQVDATNFANIWPISINGNAAQATKLQTARTINGVAFDGTANITIAAGEPVIAAGTTAQYWAGNKIWTDFGTTLRATVLTGVSTGSTGAIVATDTVLGAFGKTQGQINNLITAINTKADAASVASEFAALDDFDAYAVWQFAAGLEGWTGTGGTLNWSRGKISLLSTGTDPYITSPINIYAVGSVYDKVRARVTRTAGSGWDGTCYFSTASRGIFSSGYTKIISNPGIAIGQTMVLEWDMANLTAGNDWFGNNIRQIRLDLGSTATDNFDIEWVAIGRNGPTPQMVNVVSTSQIGGPYSMTAGTATKIGTLSTVITVGNNPIEVSFNICLGKGGTAGNAALTIKRNNIAIPTASYIIAANAVTSYVNYSGTFIDVPGPGTYTYEFYAAIENAGDNLSTISATDVRFTRYITAREMFV